MLEKAQDLLLKEATSLNNYNWESEGVAKANNNVFVGILISLSESNEDIDVNEVARSHVNTHGKWQDLDVRIRPHSSRCGPLPIAIALNLRPLSL